jgi:hypothetical protein
MERMAAGVQEEAIGGIHPTPAIGLPSEAWSPAPEPGLSAIPRAQSEGNEFWVQSFFSAAASKGTFRYRAAKKRP